MKLGAVLLLTFFFVNSVSAANFDGIITKSKTQISIKLSTTGKNLFINSATSEIQNQINRLKTSDFISLQGFLDSEQGTILVQSLNYVGLSDLLGKWSGNDEFCYFFRNFSEISIYSKTASNKCVYSAPHLARELTYTVNPTTPNWLVLLSDTQDSYLMDLVLKSKSAVDLSLYDSASGDILKEIKLKR